jgi:N-acetyl-anhydromuramoyl-L-alanine amidase
MRIDKATGLIENINFIPSPNYNLRPENCEIDLLVIHGISLPPGQFGGDDVQALFTNTLNYEKHSYYASLRDMKVSAHLFIRRDGTIIQFVPFHLRAWHAGISNFHGRENCNDFAIGVELEGTDEIPYAVAQYQQLVRVIHALQNVYPGITAQRIVGHSDIAPGRKTDPGPAFDWQQLHDTRI